LKENAKQTNNQKETKGKETNWKAQPLYYLAAFDFFFFCFILLDVVAGDDAGTVKELGK
jgi:hypothetical protein